MMKKSKKKTLDQKINKYAKIAKAIGMLAVTAFSIYRLIPKDEKFNSVDGNVLAESRTVSID